MHFFRQGKIVTTFYTWQNGNEAGDVVYAPALSGTVSPSRLVSFPDSHAPTRKDSLDKQDWPISWLC